MDKSTRITFALIVVLLILIVGSATAGWALAVNHFFAGIEACEVA